jgi:excinuclease ABC subunit B
LDNRPLKIEEFMELQNQIVFASATPADRELELCKGVVGGTGHSSHWIA